MFFKRSKNKRFEYMPRFYVPEHDEEERRKRRLGFRQFRKYNKKGTNKIIFWALAILLIIWFIVKYYN